MLGPPLVLISLGALFDFTDRQWIPVAVTVWAVCWIAVVAVGGRRQWTPHESRFTGRTALLIVGQGIALLVCVFLCNALFGPVMGLSAPLTYSMAVAGVAHVLAFPWTHRFYLNSLKRDAP